MTCTIGENRLWWDAVGCHLGIMLRRSRQMGSRAKNEDTDQPSLREPISLREAAELGGLSPSHLRLLVSRGDMWGIKLGQNWFATAEAVQEYAAQDRRPGPIPAPAAG